LTQPLPFISVSEYWQNHDRYKLQRDRKGQIQTITLVQSILK